MRTFLFSGELQYSFRRREDGEIEMEGGKGMSVILEKQINGMNLSSCRITQCLSKVTNEYQRIPTEQPTKLVYV